LTPSGKNREDFDKEIDQILVDHKIDLVVGAGYMRILSPGFVKKWYGRLINIHPALLPSFKGANGQSDAFEYGVKISGCTTHFMDGEMDHGPIILQAAVKVLTVDDRDSLGKRILEVEHQILPRTIDLFEKNCLEIVERKVIIKKDESWMKKYKVIPDVLYPEGY
jgi:phosphoribosylglycinamide formyltransferase-1